MLMGDLNFDYWSLGRNQRALAPIRDLVVDEVVTSGWFQLIKDYTRSQKNSINSQEKYLSAEEPGYSPRQVSTSSYRHCVISRPG